MRLYQCSACLSLLAILFAGVSSDRSSAADRPEKSVTVYPIVLSTDRQIPESVPVRLAEVLGTFLERAGMNETKISERSFSLPKDRDLAGIATAFGDFVKDRPPATSCAILTQIVTDADGISRIRIIVADRDGKVLLSQDADRDAFAASDVPPRDPMSACVFVARQLRAVWDLEDPLREHAPQGEMARRMAQRSGMPPQAEMDAMKPRLRAFQSQTKPCTVTVFPVHLWQGWEHEQARQLAEGLNASGLFRASIAPDAPPWNVQGDPNQLKILWDTARSFREFLRANPPETQYALLADYGLPPSANGEQAAHHVHLILCTAQGDWVMVDYQNSHHADFQAVTPKSSEACTRLALTRLNKRTAASEP